MTAKPTKTRSQMAALLKAAGNEAVAKEAADRRAAPRLSKALRDAVLAELFNRKVQ